jgi:hypothetical protein
LLPPWTGFCYPSLELSAQILDLQWESNFSCMCDDCVFTSKTSKVILRTPRMYQKESKRLPKRDPGNDVAINMEHAENQCMNLICGPCCCLENVSFCNTFNTNLAGAKYGQTTHTHTNMSVYETYAHVCQGIVSHLAVRHFLESCRLTSFSAFILAYLQLS